VAVTRRFGYSTFLSLDVSFYSKFSLVISCYWLLHKVSYTRHIHLMALVAILLKHSITRYFNYSTFQRFRAWFPTFQTKVTPLVANLDPSAAPPSISGYQKQFRLAIRRAVKNTTCDGAKLYCQHQRRGVSGALARKTCVCISECKNMCPGIQ